MLAAAGATRMGNLQYWTARVRDPKGRLPESFEPYRWAAGSHAVFTVNGAGLTPQAVQHALDQLPEGAAPTQDFLHTAGLHYWMGHDHYDRLAANAWSGRAVRVASVGAFYAPLTVRYFFGIPRSGSFQSLATDVKSVNIAAVAPTTEQRAALLSQAGLFGSFMEGAVWEVLMGQDAGESAASSAAVLAAANELGIPIHTVTRDNAAAVLPLLQISSDAKREIQFAAGAGYNVVVPEREVTLGGGLARQRLYRPRPGQWRGAVPHRRRHQRWRYWSAVSPNRCCSTLSSPRSSPNASSRCSTPSPARCSSAPV